MSVFTHGVTTKGKPRLINRNQVFTVLMRRKLLSMQRLGGSAPQCRRIPMGTGAFFRNANDPTSTIPRFVPAYLTKSAVLRS
jgi:hypothetical protein